MAAITFALCIHLDGDDRHGVYWWLAALMPVLSPRPVRRGTLRLFLLFLSFWPLSCSAFPAGYAGLSYGISWQQLPPESDGAVRDTVLSQTGYANAGFEWLPGISTGLMVLVWGDKHVNEASEVLQFDGISAGWEASVRLPLEWLGLQRGVGPYWRYGRHCWVANATGLLKPWSQRGCSVIRSWGINFPMPDYPDLVIFAEYSDTYFRDINSEALSAGVQVRF